MIWMPVLEGFYEVSSTGLVRRRLAPRAGRMMSASPTGNGYLKVSVCVRGKERTLLVHRLVAEGFHVRTDGLDVVNHRDGNKTNNCADNLEWTTSAGNSQHASSTGLAPSGVRHGRATKPTRTARGSGVNTARINETQAIEARALRAEGWTIAQLCARFEIGKSAMHALCTRKNWKHIP